MYIKNVIFNAQIPLLKAYIFLIFRPPSTKLGLAELGVENFHAVCCARGLEDLPY